MRVRTFVGILIALAVAVSVSYLSQQNVELLKTPFRLGESGSVPVYVVFLLVFLLGFLPVVSVLLVQTLKRDLAQRRERRLNREAKSLRGNFRRAVDLQTDGQWGRSLAELEALFADQPEDFETLVRYGEALRHLGRAEEAVEVHRRASVLYPQSVAVLYELAEDYDALGQSDVAQQVRDRILRDYPDCGLRVIRQRRNAALAAGDWVAASRLQERIETILADNGDDSDAAREAGVRRGLAYQQAVDHLDNDRLDEAEAILRGILEAEPRFLPASLMLGEAALERGDEPGAVARWRLGFLATGSPTFLQRIEDHFIERTQPLEAIETLHGLIAEAENDLLPRFFLGRLYYRLEMHGEALKTLAGLGERIQSSPTYHFLLARIHERRGEMRKAVEAYLVCVQQAGIPAAEYSCRICHSTYRSWQDRCDACGSWDSVELDFAEERVSAEELGIHERPVWSVSPDVEEGAGAASERKR